MRTENKNAWLDTTTAGYVVDDDTYYYSVRVVALVALGLLATGFGLGVAFVWAAAG